MSDEYGQTLAAFVLDSGKQSRRLLKRVQEIDAVDPNVKIVDAAIADRTRFRVKVHQTEDLGGAKGTVRGAGLGVIVGAIVLGPAGAVVAAPPWRPERASEPLPRHRDQRQVHAGGDQGVHQGSLPNCLPNLARLASCLPTTGISAKAT